MRFKSGQISFDEFKRIRNQVTGELRVSKREYYSKLLNDFRDNIKKTWNILNNILKTNKIHDKSNINSLLINGTLINDPIVKSFAQKSPPIVSNELQKHRDKKSIALFNVLLFRMSLKSIDIKISIAHCFE